MKHIVLSKDFVWCLPDATITEIFTITQFPNKPVVTVRFKECKYHSELKGQSFWLQGDHIYDMVDQFEHEQESIFRPLVEQHRFRLMPHPGAKCLTFIFEGYDVNHIEDVKAILAKLLGTV